MTNGEKYKTAQERAEAFLELCHNNECHSTNCTQCQFAWLNLEAEEEKPLPCPFCGAKCEVCCHDVYDIECPECGYTSAFGSTECKAIAAHNRVAKAVKESEGEG